MTLQQELDELKKQLTEVDDDIFAQRNSLNMLYKNRAKIMGQINSLTLGVKEGDIVIDKNGRKAKVLSMQTTDSISIGIGIRIKKNGSEGAEIKLYLWDNWKKLEE